jgi:predicted MFS family arabinose efflux permease
LVKPAHPVKPRLFYGWYIVAAAWVMMFLPNAVSVSVFFKPILDEFKWDRATLSLVYTFAIILSAIVSPFLGRFIDRFGPRVMLFVSLTGQAGSNLFYGLSSSLWHVFTGRFLYDIKAFQASQVLINRWFLKKRGQAQGIAATGMPFGSLALVPLSQYLILAWGWRPTMFFWAGVSFLIVLPLILLVRNTPAEKGLLPDGDTADSGFAAGLPPGNNISAATRDNQAQTFLDVARLPSFWLLAATQLICGIGCGFMMTHIVIFTTDYHYSEMIGASLVSVQGGVNLIGVLLTGHISDRYARNRVLALTHIVRSLAFFAGVVFILRGGGPLWVLYLSMVLFGFGWFTTSPLTSGLVADLFGSQRMGTIIGVTVSCHTVGMALGAYGGGITYELTGSYCWFFLLQGALELLAAGCAFMIRRVSTPK